MDSTGAAVSISREELECVLTLRGGFHLDLARELHQAALQLAETGGRVMVDCSQMEHLDGCLIQVLLALKLALERGGGSLALRGASQEIRKYLEWGGMARHFADRVAARGPRKRARSARKSSP